MEEINFTITVTTDKVLHRVHCPDSTEMDLKKKKKRKKKVCVTTQDPDSQTPTNTPTIQQQAAAYATQSTILFFSHFPTSLSLP
jgi:hypothetical protein